jgi:hypothetical protein
VKRSELLELHYITPIANVLSILQRGILCHNNAQKLNPASVAMPEIQAKRAQRTVPGGMPLHQYANIYFSARNPMMYKRHEDHLNLTVLRVSTAILDLPGSVIADGNASSGYTAFWPSPAGLEHVEGNLVFAEYWTDPDPIQRFRKTRIKCAEVLVPHLIQPQFITGAYVSCQEAWDRFMATGAHLPLVIDAALFFKV